MSAALPDLCVARFRLDGHIDFASPSLRALLGYGAGEAPRSSYLDTIRTVDGSASASAWSRALAGEQVSGRFRVLGRQGRSVWMEGTQGLVRGAGGEPLAVLLCGVDVSTKHLRSTDCEAQLRAITRSLPVVEFDLQGHIIAANDRFLEQMGYRFEELVGRHHAVLLDPRDAASEQQTALWSDLREGRFGSGRFRRRTKDGRTVWIVASIHPILDDDGIPAKVVEYAADITERAAMDARLAASELRFRGLFESSPVGMVLSDADAGQILEMNDAFLRYTGYGRQELIGTAMPQLGPDGAAVRHAGHASGDLEACRFGPIERRIPCRDGSILEALVAGMRTIDAEGREVLWSLVQDISQRKALEHELRTAARLDKLTGLYNRAEFLTRLRVALRRAADGGSALCAVLFLDLDRFKLINDTLGHDAGDALLKAFSARLRVELGAADPGEDAPAGDVVARFGGDEFAVLADGLPDAAAAEALAARLLAAATRPYELSGREVHSSVSVGIVLSRGEESAETVMRHADVAMYEAKHAGKRRCVTFNDAMQVRLSRELAIESALRRALDAGQLYLVYQPIVDLGSRRVVSAEALLRWTHPELGPLSPSEFIPIAEDSGLIIPIGHWVLDAACRQFMQWRALCPQRAPDTISVNVARAQLALGEQLIEQIRDVMQRRGMPPGSLQVEITEREVMRDPEVSLRLIESIHKLGVRLAMDDFGTGASSLGCLRAYPFDTIKIDRTFLGGLDADRDVLAVMHATVQLIENLGKSSVAEGIESPTQVAILQSLGCRFGQGYLLGRPVAAEKFLDSK